LVSEGKNYKEIAEELGLEEEKVISCELSAFNYHISYDSAPEDWVSPEFVYNLEEHKAALLSPELLREIRELSDTEMKMLLKFIDEVPISEEEREWAAQKFLELQNVAHGFSERVSFDPVTD
jgi:hypothetical protein